MGHRLYRLALSYIEKCNHKWNNQSYADKLKSLHRLTYWSFDKFLLTYGADAEWRKFSSYAVLDNAIQKLGKYENAEQEIRNKAIDEFMNRMEEWNEQVKSIRNEEAFFTIGDIRKIAEGMKVGAENEID